MTYTSDRPITVDGVRLDTLAWNISQINRATAATRSADVEVPGRDGAIPSLNDPLEPVQVGLEMFVMGTDADGRVPNGSRRDRFWANLDELIHLFSKRHALLDVQETVTMPGDDLINVHPNPSGDLSNWGNIGSALQTRAMSTEQAYHGTQSVKATMPNGGRSGIKANVYKAVQTFQVGDVVEWVVHIYPSVTTEWNAWWERIGGTYRGGSASNAVTIQANTWGTVRGRYVITDTTSTEADTSYHGFGAYNAGGAAWLANEVFWADAVVVVRNPSPHSLPIPDYFDGDTPEDANYRYSWTGTPGASPSLAVRKSIRRAMAKVTGSIQPDMNAVGSSGQFTVGLTIPAGVWEDAATQDWTSDQITSGVAQEVTTLRGATERIQDAVILVQGPATNPRLTDPATGAYVELQATLSASQFWRVNVGTWATRYGASLGLGSADTTGTDGQAVTRYGGTENQAAFLPLTPVRDTDQRRVKIALSATSGITTATRVSVRARRKYAL